MDPKIALAQELDTLADITDQFAKGDVTRQELWQQEARVHRARAALYRHESGEDTLRRAVRALAGLDPDFLQRTTPDAMLRVMGARGWTKRADIPFPGDPSRVAFRTYDHPTAQGTDRGKIVPAVLVPQGTDAPDYPRRVVAWAHDLAIRHGDVAPAEVLAEAWSGA